MTASNLDEMEYAELCFRADMIDEEKADSLRDSLCLGAFIGWQMGAGGKDKSFGAYKKGLGLASDESPLDPEVAKLMAEKAREKADRIVKLAQRKNKHG